MHANNEIGVVNDIAGIGEICRERGVIYHVDAAQSTGKLPLDMETMKVDLLSISAHKMYGPKGIGALYVRRKPRVRIEAQMHGGGHERGMRSGTLATHQIVGLGEAARIANAEMQAEGDRLKALRQRFWDAINDIPEVHMNGSRDHRLPGALNVSFAFVEGESLLMSLKDLAISSGSACTSASLEPSYVLRALGLNDELAHSSLRLVLDGLRQKTMLTRQHRACGTPSTNYVSSRRFGICIKTALISTQLNGQRTNLAVRAYRSRLWLTAKK